MYTVSSFHAKHISNVVAKTSGNTHSIPRARAKRARPTGYDDYLRPVFANIRNNNNNARAHERSGHIRACCKCFEGFNARVVENVFIFLRVRIH